MIYLGVYMTLIDAAEIGDVKTVRALIKAGADVNARDKHGWTALMIATANGQTDVVETLIKAGADVNAVDEDSVTALMIAALNDHTDAVNVRTVNALIEAKADI